jgi:hypothetical protein
MGAKMQTWVCDGSAEVFTYLIPFDEMTNVYLSLSLFLSTPLCIFISLSFSIHSSLHLLLFFFFVGVLPA